MEDLAVAGDRQAAEDNQVVLVARAASRPADARYLRMALIRRSGDERIESDQPPLARVMALMLRIDLLEAEDIGAQSEKLRSDQLDPFAQAGAAAAHRAQVLDVEGGDAHRCGAVFG